MALISKIRKNSWILIVLIGLGLGGFIIMDMTSGQQSIFGSQQFIVGKIDGKKLEWNQFYRIENLMYGNSGTEVYSRRDYLWNYFVEEAIVSEQADAMGLGVSRTELLDLEFGPNPSAVIRQRFIDPTTQALDRQQLQQFRTFVEGDQFPTPELRSFWAYQEKEIVKDRLQNKINALVTKALYTPSWMAEMGYVDQTQQIEFAYVKVPFDEIDNTEVTLSDADFEAFLKENEALYKLDEETRQVEYVVFNVAPTSEDSAKWRQDIVTLIPEFEQTSDDSSFAERNNGIYDPAYLPKESLSPVIADTVFSMALGTVYGPYIEGGYYKAIKVIDRKIIPDSVRSRHILVPANDPLSEIQASRRVDSLKNLIVTGVATFDTLAKQFGTDATAPKGGDLGYAFPGQMVKPFNDLIFFNAEVGQLYTVTTQFGVHLVEVTDKKFINNIEGAQLAYLQEEIIPTEESQMRKYEDVMAFIGTNRALEDLTAAVDANPAISLESSPFLRKNDYAVGTLGANQASRDIVRWAFSADKGDVSPEIYTYQDPVSNFTNKYVVAALRSIQKPGLPTVENVRDQIEPQVINRKKGEILQERMAGQDLPALAASFDTQADTLQATFSQSFIGNLGSEPKVIGSAFNLEQGQLSEPIVGNTGVYMVKLLNKPQIGPATNIPQLRRTMASSMRAQVGVQLMQAMRKNASIEDNRSKFY